MRRHLGHRHLTPFRDVVCRRDEQDEFVAADGNLEQPFLFRMKRERAEIEAALLDLDGNLPRRDAPHVDRDVGIAVPEFSDERQQRVDRRFIRPDEHAAAPQITQLAHGRLGLFGQTHEPLAVVLQHLAGVGQRAGLR